MSIVMQLAETGPLYICMQQNGVTNIFDLVSIRTSEIPTLTYKDAEKNVLPLNRGEIGLFRAFIGFILYRSAIGDPIDDADWLQVMAAEFNCYRISPDFIESNSGTTTGTTVTRPTVTHTPRAKDPVAEFKRGIKRDITYFTPLKEEKQWDTWQCTTIALARAQDVSEVLEPTYVPTTSEETELFNEKQKYMYAAFEINLLTDQGKAFIRDYQAHMMPSPSTKTYVHMHYSLQRHHWTHLQYYLTSLQYILVMDHGEAQHMPSSSIGRTKSGSMKH
jgi:hypothetical protein